VATDFLVLMPLGRRIQVLFHYDSAGYPRFQDDLSSLPALLFESLTAQVV
jgi:hypothetical protein